MDSKWCFRTFGARGFCVVPSSGGDHRKGGGGKVTGPCPHGAPLMSSSQPSPTPSHLCRPGARSCCPVQHGCSLLCCQDTRQWLCARLCQRRYIAFLQKLSGTWRALCDGSFFCPPACLSRFQTQWVTCSPGCHGQLSGAGLLTPPGTCPMPVPAHRFVLTGLPTCRPCPMPVPAHRFVLTGLPTCRPCGVYILPYPLNRGWTGGSTGGGGLLLRHVESLSLPA